MSETFYLTTAIDYPLGQPHLGNAFEKIGADVQARYRRMQGYDTRLLLGSDEHTVLVPRHAAQVGTPTVDYVEERAAQMRSAWRRIDISLDHFIRTSDAGHEHGCQQFLQRLYDAGFIYKKRHASLYCENCEEYKTPAQLRDGCCVNHPGLRAIEVREENYFFTLSAFQDRLLDLYRTRPDFIQPENVGAEIVAEVQRGLNDVAITRQSVEWGSRAPFDSSQTIYVWVDALSSYITAVGYGQDESMFRRWWPADMQVIGKDIAWFHCVLWPALLIAGGIEVPRRIQVHGLMLHHGEKMSKTIGNAVAALDLVDRFGVDAVRFFLMRECPFRGNADFSHERFVDVYNSDLVEKLGDLFDTTVSLSVREAGSRGIGSRLAAPHLLPGSGDLAELIQELHGHMTRCEYDRALAKIVERVLDPAMWHLAAERTRRRMEQSEESRVGVLIDLVAALRVIAILLKPFMPATSARIYRTFSFEPEFEALSLDDAATPITLSEASVSTQLTLGGQRPLFLRAEERQVPGADPG